MTSYNNSIKLHHINTIISVTYKVLVQVITVTVCSTTLHTPSDVTVCSTTLHTPSGDTVCNTALHTPSDDTVCSTALHTPVMILVCSSYHATSFVFILNSEVLQSCVVPLTSTYPNEEYTYSMQ